MQGERHSPLTTKSVFVPSKMQLHCLQYFGMFSMFFSPGSTVRLGYRKKSTVLTPLCLKDYFYCSWFISDLLFFCCCCFFFFFSLTFYMKTRKAVHFICQFSAFSFLHSQNYRVLSERQLLCPKAFTSQKEYTWPLLSSMVIAFVR